MKETLSIKNIVSVELVSQNPVSIPLFKKFVVKVSSGTVIHSYDFYSPTDPSNYPSWTTIWLDVKNIAFKFKVKIKGQKGHNGQVKVVEEESLQIGFEVHDFASIYIPS
jgi:hypothetical protein